VNWREEYKRKLTTPQEAAKRFESNDVIGVGGGTSIPPLIMEALAQRAHELRNIKICQGFAVALHDYMKPEYRDSFRVETIFIGPAERLCMGWGTCDFVPNHLGSMRKWGEASNVNKGALVVTPPDEDGYMNRSLFGGLVPKVIQDRWEYVAVEVNENAPWLVSDDFKIHISQVDAIVENHAPLFEVPDIPITPVEETIAGIISDMIPHGSTIQLGLGGLANCIGHFLKDKKNLGIHSEVMSNSLMELIKCGAADGSKKTLMPGKAAFTFAVGTRELYSFLDRNADCPAFEIEYINDPKIIALNDNMVSVNNALMVDLTGQVASESIGPSQYSATGGQVNFVLGAQMAKNGTSILALPSTRKDKDGNLHSRILDMLPLGTIITTSRNDVEWIVTEYGAAKLTNKSLSWRAKNLIALAHPDFRDELTFKAKKLAWI
jgi:4-hydroxybutyrate CoA-transferase